MIDEKQINQVKIVEESEIEESGIEESEIEESEIEESESEESEIEEAEKRTPKTDSDANIVVHNYYPNDIVKDYTKENVNVLQCSPSNSNEVSMITEEISEKTRWKKVKSCWNSEEKFGENIAKFGSY